MTTLNQCNKCKVIIGTIEEGCPGIVDFGVDCKWYRADLCDKCARRLIEEFNLEEE